MYYSLLYLAIIGAGGRFVGSNPAYTTYELSHLFHLTETKHVIVEPDLLKNVRSAAQECGISESDVLVFNTDEKSCPEEFQSWWKLLDHGETDWHTFDDEKESKSTVAALMSTSGTTGLPKAAALSHFALVAQSVMYYDSKEKPYEVCHLS